MERANAEEFYEVYKGVVPEYPVSIKLRHSVDGRLPLINNANIVLTWFLTEHGDRAVLRALHGVRDPWHRHTQVIQGILWAP